MIAAYIGNQHAATILTEMTRRQEFIFGGFYTGIATCSDGRLERRRVIGSVCDLEREADFGTLPGTVGIAHSRTDDAGGIEWSQPRFDCDSSVASVGVGIGGAFRPGERTQLLAEKLLSEGAHFRTRTEFAKKNGIGLSDGAVVHGGEVYLLALAALLKTSGSFLHAVRELGIPSESVGVYLRKSTPSTLLVVNHNQRVLVGLDGAEVFLATSRLAFLRPPEWLVELPMNTFATVSTNGVELEPLWPGEPRFDWSIPQGGQASFLDVIRMSPGIGWQDAVTRSLNPLLPEGKATMGQILGHRLLEDLLASGKIRYEIRRVQGQDGQPGIPQIALFLNDGH